MQNTENQFDKLLTTSQSISLSKEEKEEAKADYDIALVQLRLEEIEKVSVQKKLDGKKTATVKNLLDSHIASAKGRIASIKQQKGSNAGVEASATLEASLQAH